MSLLIRVFVFPFYIFQVKNWVKELRKMLGNEICLCIVGEWWILLSMNSFYVFIKVRIWRTAWRACAWCNEEAATWPHPTLSHVIEKNPCSPFSQFIFLASHHRIFSSTPAQTLAQKSNAGIPPGASAVCLSLWCLLISDAQIGWFILGDLQIIGLCKLGLV